MQAVCAVAEKSGVWILADEIYRGAELGRETTNSFWGRGARVICTAGFSKAYGLPGLRVGWVAGPPELVDKLWSYHDYTSIAPTALSDHLATLVLEPARHARVIQRTRSLIAQNYPPVAEWIAAHAQWFTHRAPDAGAIAWLGWRGAGTADDFAQALLDKKSVLVVPGSQFGMGKYLRIGFGGHTDKLHAALARISSLLKDFPARAATQSPAAAL
jgi:aspartate/methionine/tyrosine aminotransferase